MTHIGLTPRPQPTDWRCRAIDRPTVTWTGTGERIAPRAALSDRVRARVTRRVGQHARTVAEPARQSAVGRHTVMRPGLVWRARRKPRSTRWLMTCVLAHASQAMNR